MIVKHALGWIGGRSSSACRFFGSSAVYALCIFQCSSLVLCQRQYRHSTSYVHVYKFIASPTHMYLYIYISILATAAAAPAAVAAAIATVACVFV